MKQAELWRETKYEFANGHLRASRDTKQVSVGSRLNADIIAHYYEKYIPKYVHGVLLDLGCGFAPLYSTYKDYALDVILSDWANTLHSNIHLDFVCDLTKELPIQSETIDSLILSDVLEHIPNPTLLFDEMYRILKKDGKLIMNVPFYYWIHEAPHDYYRYTEYALRMLAEQSKLKVVKLHSVGGTGEIMADIISKKLVSKNRRLSFFLADRIQAGMLKRNIKRKNHSRVFPLGYFMIAEKI